MYFEKQLVYYILYCTSTVVRYTEEVRYWGGPLGHANYTVSFSPTY